MRALAAPSVPVPMRANEKPGTAHRSEWHLLARESGGGAGPWPLACGVSPGPPKISRSPRGGRTFGSQAQHCQLCGLALSFPICNRGCLNGDWEGGSCKDFIRQPSAPLHLWPYRCLRNEHLLPPHTFHRPRGELWDLPASGSFIYALFSPTVKVS